MKVNQQTIIAEFKRFFGPLLCLVASYATLKCLHVTLLMLFQWPWGNTTPTPVSYIVGGLFGLIGFTIVSICAAFAWQGWEWFRTSTPRK